ncbi:hypothetical protein PspLS_10228 [Pyricularia sp. CBS 133598]|nr:hypothetical protein PspLS_10228 [Pyricularia sp. CBS 133598]
MEYGQHLPAAHTTDSKDRNMTGQAGTIQMPTASQQRSRSTTNWGGSIDRDCYSLRAWAGGSAPGALSWSSGTRTQQ